MQPIRQGGLTLTWNLKCGCYQFSLPSRLACPGVKERLKNPKSICNFCYAFNGRSGQMETAKKLLRKNWRAVHAENLLGLFQQALARLPAKTRYFRWFGCGDICDALMFNTIQVLALQFPSIRFWCPTQNWDIVPNVYLHTSNLVIRQSATCIGDPAPPGGHCTLLPGQKAPRGTFTCPGKCGPCRKCWEPWKPETRIAFPFHGSACLMAKFNKARRIHKF